MRCAFARFIDHFLRVSVRLRNNLLVTLLRFGQFFPDLLGIELALFNLSPPIFKNGEDRLVSEPTQQKCDNAEANDLRQEELPIPAECLGGSAQHVSHAAAGSRDYQSHRLNFERKLSCLRPKN